MNYRELSIGDKIIFNGTPKRHWYRNIIENSKKLYFGQVYTVRSIEPASSWCCIKLVEFPETAKFGEDWFCASCFEKSN